MIWRYGLLALAVLFGFSGVVLAHALPGSVLSLRQQGAALQLTVQFPVEDLIIAAPELSGLEEVMPGQPLPTELAAAFARYLARHLSVTKDAAPLDLKMTDAEIQASYHDHLGHFALIVSQWNLTGTGNDSTSLRMTYDAVMHEVRNHRAEVRWVEQNGEFLPVAEFGYFGATGGIALDLGAVGQE